MTDSKKAFPKAVMLSQPILETYLGTVLLCEPFLKTCLQSGTVLEIGSEKEKVYITPNYSRWTTSYPKL